MEKPEHFNQIVKINRILALEDGWAEIGTNYQHYIIMDICWRYGQACAYWPNIEVFTHNYIYWVEKYISPLSTDSASKWEQWGEMARAMTLGT